MPVSPVAGRLTGALPAAVALIVLPLAVVRPVLDPSPWLHLKVGQFLLGGGRFGTPDPWSTFASNAYLPTQWLPSILTAELVDRVGLPGVAFVRAAGVICLCVALLHLARAVGASSRTALALAALGILASYPGLTERPQLLGFVLLVPTITAWWRTGSDLRPRWWLVPYSWVFAMCHGLWATSLVIGAVVWVGLAAERRLDRGAALRLGAVLVGSLAAAALTPLGPRLVLTPLTVGESGRQFVAEWLPSSVRTPTVALVLAMLAAVYLIWVLGTRPQRWQVLLWVAGLAFTLSMQRTVPIGAFLAVALLGTAWTGRPRSVERHAAPLAPRECLVMLAAATAAVALAAPLSVARAERARGVPTALTHSLRALPTGTVVLAEGDVSGWLIYTSPQLRPVMDIRAESFSAQHLGRYLDTMHVEKGWDGFVRDTRSSAAPVPTRSPIALALTEQLHWRSVGTDAGFVLLERPA